MRSAASTAAAAMATGDDRCIGYAVHQVFEPCTVDDVLEDGQELVVGGLHVCCIAAPGHAEGLVVYEIVLEGERCWFVGDLLITTHAHSEVELPWTGGPDFDKAAYLRSMARLIHMPCDHVLPGHGPAAIGCGKRIVEEAYTQAMRAWR